MRLLITYQDTRENGEDFVLTPYVFLVLAKFEIIKVYGFGVGMFYWAIAFNIGFNVPKEFPFIKKMSNKNDGKDTLEKAVSALDDYLNAGTKEAREEASKTAKEVYEQFYGVPYKNRIER